MDFVRFVAKANAAHKNRYSYMSDNGHICAICKSHGAFDIDIEKHLAGQGCPDCRNNKSINYKQRFADIYGDKYDYSLLPEKMHNKAIITVICPKHGKFNIRASKHLHGKECPKCHRCVKTWAHINYCEKHQTRYKTECTKCKKIKRNTQKFWKAVSKHHAGKYIYPENLEIYNITGTITYKCPEHGTITQSIANHIRGSGCKKCGYENRTKLSRSQILQKLREIHNNKYDYSLAHSMRMGDRITIICPEHGEFVRNVLYHMRGFGCPTCAAKEQITKKQIKLSTGTNRANNYKLYLVRALNYLHHNKYEYENREVTKLSDIIKIKCLKCGRKFTQRFGRHIRGHGCYCINRSKKRSSLPKINDIVNRLYDGNITITKFTSHYDPIEIFCAHHGKAFVTLYRLLVTQKMCCDPKDDSFDISYKIS